MPPVKWAAIGIKIGVSALLAWLVLAHVDFVGAGALLRSGRGLTAFVIAIGVLTAQAVIAGMRTACVIHLLGARCSIGRGFAVWMVGLLVSQSLITFLAGDAARLWQLIRLGYSRRVAANAIVLERALGLVVLLAMVLLCEPELLARTSPGTMQSGLAVLAVTCVGGIVAFAASAFLGGLRPLLPAPVRDHALVDIAVDVASTARHLTRSWKLAAAIISSSALMQLCSIVVIFTLARSVGVSIDFWSTAAVALPALLIAMIPISLAGWGVREGAMVVGYGLFGIAPAPALAVSIAFGLAMLVASLPGTLFIRLSKDKQAAMRHRVRA